MSIRRVLAVASASVLLVTSLSACILLPGLPTGNNGGDRGPDGDVLVDTSWSGTDSDGDSWTLLFQEDGTIGLTYNDSTYDDATDTWSLDDGELRIRIAFGDGNADLEGDFEGLDSPIDLSGEVGDHDFTLRITRD